MSNTPVIGTGPIEFMSEAGAADQGKQLSIPLTELYFDSNGVLKGDRWPLYVAHKDAVDKLLAYVQQAGAVQPGSAPAPAAALKVTARYAGAAGNNIKLIVTKSGTSDPADATKFDAELVEQDSYPRLTKDTIEKVVGSAQGAALIFITPASAAAKPKAAAYPMLGGAQPFKVSVLDANGNQAFEVNARNANDDEAKYTTITISGVSNDPADPKFDLTVGWDKSGVGLHPADLQPTFAYEITVGNPPDGNALGVPGNGTVLLSGGSDPAQATPASAVVIGAD